MSGMDQKEGYVVPCQHCRRYWQWHVLAGFAGYDAPRAVFPSVVNARGDSTGAVLGQGDVPVVILSDAFAQTARKTVVVPQMHFIDGHRHSFRTAEAVP